MSQPTLLIIDPQEIFTTPSSAWGSPMWKTAAANIERLVPAFEQIILTRWIPPQGGPGSWREYMEAWPFAAVPADDPLLDFSGSFAGLAGAAIRNNAVSGPDAVSACDALSGHDKVTARDAGSRPGQRIHCVDEPTFGKWTARTRAVLEPHPHLVVTGVSTDCCVLSTVIPAIDDGAYVTVIMDACAGSTPDNHAAALHCMSLYPPQITLTTTAAYLEERAAEHSESRGEG